MTRVIESNVNAIAKGAGQKDLLIKVVIVDKCFPDTVVWNGYVGPAAAGHWTKDPKAAQAFTFAEATHRLALMHQSYWHRTITTSIVSKTAATVLPSVDMLYIFNHGRN